MIRYVCSARGPAWAGCGCGRRGVSAEGRGEIRSGFGFWFPIVGWLVGGWVCLEVVAERVGRVGRGRGRVEGRVDSFTVMKGCSLGTTRRRVCAGLCAIARRLRTSSR